MKILVCVKVVDGELNPFDACAVEAALQLGGEVSVVSMCPPSAKEPLLALTRLGVQSVTLLTDPVFAGSDTLATGYILSLAAQKLGFDLILCGRQTVDGDTAQVGPYLATLLGIPCITNVLKLESGGETVECTTRTGRETASLPALLTVERINTLRFPSIFSKLGEVTVWSNAELGADPARCGLSGSPTKVLKVFESQSGRRECQFIPAAELPALLERLKAKPQVEVQESESTAKLPLVWAVGETVAEKAKSIAQEVRIIDLTDPREIAELAKKERPDVILWNADLWGRKNAPITAALLQTGLCADCTHLETDGEKLYMYRPARSGSVVAKIECRTLPQMATVRCAADEAELVLAGGRGVTDQMEAFHALAQRLGATEAASRALVDLNLAPYEQQIGLTGRNMQARIYIAAGISGAVQHTCAIENCGTVIAINPDRNARIFEYSDYGIVDSIEKV